MNIDQLLSASSQGSDDAIYFLDLKLSYFFKISRVTSKFYFLTISGVTSKF